MNKSNTVGQIIALNHVLSEWPMEYDLTTLLNMIHVGNPFVTISENFEDWDLSTLHDFVKSLAEDIDKEIELAMR